MIFESGYRVGAYKVVRLLGQGGMGDVYEVEHVELGTHYALKAFACDYKEAELLRKKFLDEGRSLARLEHPNVVRVFDLAVEPQSQMPYFVMDLVLYDDGEAHTIEDVDKADIDENLVYFWFKDAAAALDYIHSLGIVHCDIKPSNMLLGKDLHLKLTDFGISRIFGEKLKRDIHATPTLVTKTGLGKTVLGTEHYMAPEVALGEDPTPAADAYALGMMCFRLLTGLWYEPGTDAISLLAKFKFRWMSVLPQLLSIHPEKRPKELYRLKERLKGTPVSAPQPKLEPKKPVAKRRRNVLAVVIGMAIAVAICGGLYNGGKYAYEEFQKWQAEQNRIRRVQYEEQLRAKEAQARKLQELEAKLKERTSQAKVKETVLTQVVTQVAQNVPAQEGLQFAKDCFVLDVVYGLFDAAGPVDGQSVDLTDRLLERMCAGVRRFKVNNAFAGGDPAPKQHKQTRVRYRIHGREGTLSLNENEWFELTDDDVVRGTGEMPKRPQEKMEIVGKIEDKVDYGPIPDKKYTWLANGIQSLPQPVRFQLSNGTSIDFVPLKAATFYMSNDWQDGKTHHKVTLTRPFWMSKYCVTVSQWRECFPAEFDDCVAIEKAVGPDYPVSGKVSRKQIDAYCKYLSAKYKSQLPEGYVFRLASEAEWEYAIDIDNTVYKYGREGGWCDATLFDHESSKRRMEELRKSKGLDRIYAWEDRREDGAFGGWSKDRQVFVGGRLKPYASGVCDMLNSAAFLLDTVRDPEPLVYADEEIDPLRWVDGADIRHDKRSLAREWAWWRKKWDDRARHIFHLVVGPDLVAERAWENTRTNLERRPRKELLRKPAWNVKNAPRKISRPKEFELKLDNGAKMVFCTCPKGTFYMSNVPEQVKRSHKVTLTYPFWMSKYRVTAEQWRDFGPYDCEGVPQQLEKIFKKEGYPICVMRNYRQWEKFCAYLTERYRAALPPGYVFRLPTEAEWEWALVADEKGSAYDIDGNRFDHCNGRFRGEFAELLKKKRVSDFERYDTAGAYRDCFIGGRVQPNAWGVCDMRSAGWVLDSYDADWRRNPEVRDSSWCDPPPQREIIYADAEVDPFHTCGRLSTRFLVRDVWRDRHLSDGRRRLWSHIVVGPDLLSNLKKKEVAPYSETDFGGTFLGDYAKVTDMSSMHEPQWRNTPERHKLLLSRESVIEREMDKNEDLRGCHTQREDSPWVQIELDQKRIIAGIQVDVMRWIHFARHLRIWMSDDGKKWVEIAKEDRELHRYRFDLTRKNVKTKYLRVGREPGFINEWFALNKVLIYGK